MLITSISGIRGTIGGIKGENLSPIDLVNFISAYGSFLRKKHKGDIYVTIGRDARVSGFGLSQIAIETLRFMGINVIDCGLVPTPTVEMAVVSKKAQGGLIITASHNPKEYNGIKMLNSEGEFLTDAEGKDILNIIATEDVVFSDTDNLGTYQYYKQALSDHIQKILELPIMNLNAIKEKRFTVVVDAINSVGGIAVPLLLEKLNVVYVPLYCEADGMFAHSPEPLEKNLGTLKDKVKETGADLGIAVDPDVDRLVLVDENGEMFGEEYSLVACADAVLSYTQGAVVTNLSSSRATGDIARNYSCESYASAVGEKNVVNRMKEVNAVIGGEGSGGIIYPKLHHGRDALVGIALVLNLLSERSTTLSSLKATYPSYVMIKDKISVEGIDPQEIIEALSRKYSSENINTTDGLRIDFKDSWVHLRSSNTEPIMRIYAEAKTKDKALGLVKEIRNNI